MEVTTATTQPYLIVFEDQQEAEFDAIDDSHAIGLSQKQYSGQKWKLYRIAGGQRVMVCDRSPECRQDAEEKKENVH
jgi:hypothetical protein